MPGTFSQIYIQIVFAVKGRESLIGNSWKTDLITIGLINILPEPLKAKGKSQSL